jgi:hypothetical protein
MLTHTRKIVGIILGYRETKRATLNGVIKLSEIPERFGYERFNPAHANIFGIQSDDFQGRIAIGLTHPEFREIPDYELIPEYYIDEARKKFPYLFVDTNPLLWRKFND